MDVSIVVLTYNREVALAACLAAIERNTRGLDYQLIVINNGSTDGTADLLGKIAENAQRGFQIIHVAKNEYVCARNYGIERAVAPVIAQVDDDVIVHPGWAETLLAPFSDPEIGATGQHGFYQEQSWSATPWSAGLIDDRRRPMVGQYADLLMGFCWAWRRRARDGGLFLYDPAFNPFWHEESDLQLAIRANKYRLKVVPEIATHNSLHPWNETDDPESPVSKFQAARNFELLKKKWASLPYIRYEGALVGL